jgi:hypothetical protein
VKFDAYAATVAEPSSGVMGGILAAFPAAWAELTTPRHGYTSAAKLNHAGNVALVFHRTQGAGDETHVTCQGTWSAQLATHLRIAHPMHGVARVDSALDVDEPGFWDWLIPIALDLADQLGITVTHEGDWHRGELGRTLYLGSRKSAVFMRIYEKGKQLRSMREDPDASLHWVRLETQCRPEKAFKRQAWTATPHEVFCTSKVATRLLSIMDGRDYRHVPPGYVRQPARPMSVKFRNLCRSYGPFLLGLLESVPPGDLATMVRKQLDAPHDPDILCKRPELPPHDVAATLARMLSPTQSGQSADSDLAT